MEKNIAIIDDEVTVLSLLKKFLERDGTYCVDVFSKPENALESISVKKYDLIMLDIMMPNINGLEILKDLKSKSDIKVVIMTAHSTLNTTLRSETLGADGYVEKPFTSLLNLKAVIDEILS
ncbi:MAG: response regulator [Sphaerochaetaceae bacterium]|nr:response regulator [Sphaerochaetaceae bacterium]